MLWVHWEGPKSIGTLGRCWLSLGPIDTEDFLVEGLDLELAHLLDTGVSSGTAAGALSYGQPLEADRFLFP
jgi:hypothetical protein